jgi:hypothetical protein
VIGVCSGALDDRNWLDITGKNANQIFIDVSQRAAVIPSHAGTFIEHATEFDEMALAPKVFENPK